MAAESRNNTNLIYRLTFGGFIGSKGKQPDELQLNQGVRKEVSDDSNKYYMLLCGVKVNRKIYQPTEIEAELDFTHETTDEQNKKKSTAPKFSDIKDCLLQREVTLDIVENDKKDKDGKPVTYNVAKNCYVFEMTPQLQRDVDGTKMYVKLSIFSMDKLMTLNKYSKAYVASKLGSEIIKPESLNFGTVSEGVPLIASDIASQQHLMYTEGDKRLEFIQPYLVQYNESFYDFLVRTANRCGEFLFFEDGKLVLGLPERKSESDPKKESIVEISDYVTVTALERSVDPLIISGYARDAVKDGKGAVQGTADANSAKEGETVPVLNMAAIPREKSGFPKDAFPAYTSSNVELAQDDYIFPLYRGKFTNRRRELNYDGTPAQTALGRMMLFGKTMLGNELDAGLGLGVTFIIDGVLNEAVPQALATLGISTWNNWQATRYMDILKGKADQYNEQKAVQFGTLNSEGWTTLSYYKDIHRHEEEQQRKIVCINMGTNFANVKLGQKIKVDGLGDTYVIIQIEQHSEEAWNRDYDRYDKVADDKYAGSRSLKIYAIPGYGGVKKQFIPPVQPVPVIRKVGPQTAFVTANEDPKFQGRIRIAFPWQSLGGPERSQLNEVAIKLHEMVENIETLRNKVRMLLEESTKASQYVEELKNYVKATKEEREALLKPRKDKIEAIKKDLEDFKATLTSQQSEEKKAQIEKIQEEIAEFLAAAKEHDEKKGKAGYTDPEKDNSVIRKYKDIYNAKNNAYLKANAELKPIEDKKKEREAEVKKLKALIEKNLQAMSTPWVRVVTPMASPGGGTFFRPQVGDEVMVNFENDNVERPYVIGSVFSKNNTTPDEKMYRQRGNELQGKEVTMMMMSRNGHNITFTDPDGGANFLTNLVSPGLGLWGSIAGSAFNNLLPGAKDLAGGIHIGDRYGIYEIDMKSHKRSIDIRSPFGTVEIDAFSGITISAPNGNVTIRGKNINLEAGNKVNVTSGMNIQDPGLGDPEGTSHKWGKALTDIFAEIIPTELNKYMFASIVDLSYIRHIVEVFVRPVDGTLKLKSKRYLMLEAGYGNATIRRDRYAAKVAEKKETSEEFYKAMLACVRYINEKVDGFYDTYNELWLDGHQKRSEYKQIARYFLKDHRKPNLAEIASKLKVNEWNDDTISVDTFKDFFDDKMEFYNGQWIGKKTIGKYVYVEDAAKAYCEAAYKMYNHILCFHTLMSGAQNLDLGEFDWMRLCLDNALVKVDDKTDWSGSWKRLYGEGDESVLFFGPAPVPADDKFAMANKKIFKRKLLLSFISFVGKDIHNQNNKYFRCGLRIDEILSAEWIRQEFYWNRTVFNLDRSEYVNHDNYRRKLHDSTVGLFANTAKKIAAPFDRDIWNDAAGGQILFSEEESKTLNFEGEGLHEESSSNIGTLDHLKLELMAMN